eukprot:scaffold11938_cov206-Skeletonema_marinoi.AAC.1
MYLESLQSFALHKYSPARELILVFFQTRPSPSEILRPLLHRIHPHDPLPSTVRPRLHQSVCRPLTPSNPYPARPAGVFGNYIPELAPPIPQRHNVSNEADATYHEEHMKYLLTFGFGYDMTHKHQTMKLLKAISLLTLSSRLDVATADGLYWNRISTFPTCLQLDDTCNLNNYTAAFTVSTTTDGNTAIYADQFLHSLGFTDISDASNPSPAGTMSLPGKPTVVAVKDDKYVIVAVVTKDAASEGKMVVVNLATKEIMKEVDLTGEPDWLALSPDKQYAAITSSAPEGAGLSGLTNPDAPHPASISINEENKAVVSLPKNNAFVMIDVESASVIESFTQGSVDLTNVDLTDNGIIDHSDSKSGVLREADGVAWIGTEYFASANKGVSRPLSRIFALLNAASSDGGARGFTIFSSDGTVVWDSGIAVDQILTSVGHYADESSDDFGIAVENVLYAADLQELLLNSEGGHVTIVYNVSDPASPVFKQVLPSGYRPESSTYVQDRKLFITASEFDERDNKVRGSLIIYSYGDDNAQYP